MVKVISLLVLPESALGFSLESEARTGMKVWTLKAMYICGLK